MKTGALIVTTGLDHISGIAALQAEVGSITAGQRMIAALHRWKPRIFPSATPVF